MFLLFRWIMTSLAILTVPYIISGVTVANFGSALFAAAILAVLNVFVKPLLILLTLPLTFVTLGFFLLVINALLFQFASSLVAGITIASFWSALGASLFVSTVSWLASAAGDPRVKVQVRGPRSGPRPRNGRRERTLEMHQNQDGKWE